MGRGYRAVWRDGQLLAEYANGELTYLNPSYRPANRSALPAPMVIRDIGEYISPLDGSHITSRSQHRDHMRAHDVVEVGNEHVKPRPDTETAAERRARGEVIKRHLEEVRNAPQSAYDAHAAKQRAEHTAIADTITATPV